ncbi:MAG: LysM peptidoglycan-binding domain-containing protein [Methylobacteriaceae bacterium]|nr:LysM peptidoglycan-binding domain-containing protein [Methylobacteriaceae bacterium]
MIPFAVRIIAIPVIALAAAIGAFIYVRAPQRTPVAAVPQSAAPAGPQAENRAAAPQATAPQSTAALPSPALPSPALPSPAPQAAPPVAAGGAKPPEFDVVRVTPSGETVVAGRAPGAARVELLDQGKVIAGEKVDQNGQFVLLPPALSGGDHLLALRITPEGQAPVSSTQSVAVAVRPGTGPLVTLAEPGKPSVVLAAPGPDGPPVEPTLGTPGAGTKAPDGTAAPTPGQVTIRTAEVDAGGRFFATGSAPAGSTVRLYLNGSHIADAASAADGKWSLTINKGVSGGKYALRADAVGEQGKVISRAEVPFDAPAAVAAAGPVASASPPKFVSPTVVAPRPEQTGTTPEAGGQTAAGFARAGASSSGSPAQARPAPGEAPAPAASKAPAATAPAQTGTSVAASNPAANPVVPEVSTVTVTRGDSLWRISRLRLGSGMRYTVIYEANSSQIRNPNLIYSGQVFVLPGK